MTPDLVKTHVLEPALEARAHNLRQDQLLANPTVEIDSAVEHLAALKRTATTPAEHGHITALAVILDQLIQSNAAEGVLEGRVASVADRMASRTAGVAWGRERTARELRPHLANLLNPMVGDARHRDALAAVNRIAGMVTVDVLLSETVAYQLGARKFAVLNEIVAEVAA